jgi:uncharacterized protein YajQ (UPF0234 family)
MPSASSFDITSTIDFQEVDNALNQARKEVAQRYDFKGATAEITLNATDKTLTLLTDDEMKMNALWEMVQGRLVRRGVPVKNFKSEKSEPAAGSKVRRVIPIQQGIPIEAAREILKYLKDQKLKKVQAAIQADQVRVKGRAAGRDAGAAGPRLRRRPPVRQLPVNLPIDNRHRHFLASFFSFHSTVVAFSGSSFRISSEIRSVFLSSGTCTS